MRNYFKLPVTMSRGLFTASVVVAGILGAVLASI